MESRKLRHWRHVPVVVDAAETVYLCLVRWRGANEQFVCAARGPDRLLLSDLHNIGIDVEVVGGTGSVLPFIISTENASGDLMFRGGN